MESIADSATSLFDHAAIQILVIVLVALVIRGMIRQSIGRIVTKAVESHRYSSRKFELQREQTLTGILRTAASAVIWIVAVVLTLSALNVNIAALATGAGLLGVVVGFGAQDAIKDFIGGIFVIAENQYRVGDVITLDGKTGMVEDISIRVTRLRDLDGNLHIIPNGHSSTVTNMTFGHSNVNINIGISYNADIDKVKRIINDLGKQLAKEKAWKESIIEPITFLRVNSFDDSAVTLKALGKVAPGSQWEVAGEFRRRLKEMFDEKGVEIPFPQRTLHMVSDKKK